MKDDDQKRRCCSGPDREFLLKKRIPQAPRVNEGHQIAMLMPTATTPVEARCWPGSLLLQTWVPRSRA
jgi:hypothetical protein